MAQIHYEIFVRRGKGGGWALQEAIPNREDALARAKTMLELGQVAAARVVKETFQPDSGDYMSLKIFEQGDLTIKKTNKKTEDIENPVPCFKPDDLYSYHARVTLVRLIGDWLARQRLTVTELLHSAEALEKFEATGTTYQHAIQRIAVAQASDSNTPVAQIVKQLNELTTTAIHRVYKDERRGLFPSISAGQFAPLAKKLAGNAEGPYVLNGALAKYLASAKGWDEKLRRLLALMSEMPADGAERALLLGAIDALVAEMLTGNAALADLLGPNDDLGEALVNLVALFLGHGIAAAEGSGAGLNELSRYFAGDELPEARGALANRILSELRGIKRLKPSSLEAELKMLRRLANQLVLGQGKYPSNEDLIGAFNERSRRLVTHEPILQFLQDTKTPDERVERLLVVEENIIGAENKRMLATFILPILQANNFDEQIMGVGAPALNRLRRLADLQMRVLRSGFQDIQKNQIATALDASALRIETRVGVLAGLETRLANPVARAQAILKLQVAGAFTQGDLTMKARRMILALLGKPGFLNQYLAENPSVTEGSREAAVAGLVAQLEKFGIAPEDGLKAIAA
jgi:hypothetical protein